MYKFALALAEAGYAVWWNMAFQFLRLYDFLFRRISHGATRLQEILADRVAIQRFGFDAFQQGLTHVIRRSFVFDQAVNLEINDAVEGRRPLANLYSLPEPNTGDVAREIDQGVAAALEEDTTEDNTHPSPKERFRLGQRVVGATSGSSSGVVWDLFSNPESLMAELTADVATQVADSSGVNVRASHT
jgi:hypothetical protein